METFGICSTALRVSIRVPPSGGSLEIGNLDSHTFTLGGGNVPPSGGSLEIGNEMVYSPGGREGRVPPSGGSLEIGNVALDFYPWVGDILVCSPFGGIPRNWKQKFPHSLKGF